MGSPKCPSGHSWAGPSQNTKALLGKPQHDAKADFLGGTRSPRPRCEAGRKPGISSTGNARREAGWPTGHMPRSNPSPPYGRAEPAPPRGGSIQGKMA